ncbi:N-acetyltransferase [Streptomyces spiroverticillatus]|uniref:N-acetyltransferase n=1 Tax=Streptomyces finlayi TaxID=67296 RepID=A0A918WT38_9ACTN|nr:GNAT family N-acetyltransferase [Streptomyces finlayi]GGZ89574.1 N-acetyltransferase [Streptomyces spiroverticillatus]GHC80431.1 N-acetyltransferase [Streptomyces finlayi]
MTLTPPVASELSRPLPTVRLRVPVEEDAYGWYDAFKNREVMEFFGGRPSGVSVYEELTARQRKHDAELGYCLWTLLDEDDRVIGFTGAQPWPRTHYGPVGEIEIGWRLGREFWGRGYAFAAAQEAVARVRAAGVPEVVAVVDARNARSIAVTEKLGMRPAETFVVPATGAEPERSGRCFRLSL